MKKSLIPIILSLVLLLTSFSFNGYTKDFNLTEQQRNSILMLNYIAVLSTEISNSKNSRMHLEDVYSSK